MFTFHLNAVYVYVCISGCPRVSTHAPVINHINACMHSFLSRIECCFLQAFSSQDKISDLCMDECIIKYH